MAGLLPGCGGLFRRDTPGCRSVGASSHWWASSGPLPAQGPKGSLCPSVTHRFHLLGSSQEASPPFRRWSRLCPPGSIVIAGHLRKGAVSSQPSLSVPETRSRLGVGPPEPLLGGWAGTLPAFSLPPSHEPMLRSVLCPQGRNRSVYAVAEQAVLVSAGKGPLWV